MLVKFIPTGTTKKGRTGRTSGGQSAQDYLLGKDFEKGIIRDGATLLRGNPSQTTQVINGIRNQNAYKSGVISFAKEKKPTPEQLEKVMDGLENTLFPNLDKDRYSCYWVHHQDKDRDELHFIIAEIDLQTGKSLGVYYPRNDKHLVNSWAKLTIEQHGFIDPNDPLHKRTMSQTTRNEKDNAEKDLIHERILSAVEQNPNVKTRDDILEVIKSLDYEINRSTAPDSISIKNPNGKRPLKFKDGIYTKDFDRSKLPSERKYAKIQYDKDHDNRIAKYKEQYEYSLALREKRLSKRIGEIDRTPLDKNLTKDLGLIRAENEPVYLQELEQEREQLAQALAEQQQLAQSQATVERQLDRLNSVENFVTQGHYDELSNLTIAELQEVINQHQQIIADIDTQAQAPIDPDTFDSLYNQYQDSTFYIASAEYIINEIQDNIEKYKNNTAEFSQGAYDFFVENDELDYEETKNAYVAEYNNLLTLAENRLLTEDEEKHFFAYQNFAFTLDKYFDEKINAILSLSEEINANKPPVATVVPKPPTRLTKPTIEPQQAKKPASEPVVIEPPKHTISPIDTKREIYRELMRQTIEHKLSNNPTAKAKSLAELDKKIDNMTDNEIANLPDITKQVQPDTTSKDPQDKPREQGKSSDIDIP